MKTVPADGEKYWTRRIKYPTAENIDLRLYFRLERGKAVMFSLVFKYKIDGLWKNIKRCDNTKKHKSIPHCHIYKLNGLKHRENIGDQGSNLGKLARAIIDDIRINLDTILENYKYSKK